MGALTGKVALITGAGQGVGHGIATALAKEGVEIAAVGRTLEKVERAAAELAELGVKTRAYELDVTDLDGIKPMVDQVAEDFGGLDILVNNAYTGKLGKLLDLDDAGFQRGFVSGPFATFAAMKAAHPHLVARGGGNIINLVTSAMVRWDPTGYGAYAAAKQAVKAVSRTAAAEWAADGIRVNAVAPHALSPALQWWTENFPEEAAEFVKTIPMGRIGDCEADIGRAVVALVGTDLQYMTGAVLPLDGGQAYFG
ncbi:SDR family NAD(P)-dependent oxidoreductase [Enemella sp. A6]|uniref:SDR family NAD(P)-dependent oxidoreductase n=1 Tax=Enemella sp. A6 TaxID=3440152 RepID=UPI003EBD1727